MHVLVNPQKKKKKPNPTKRADHKGNMDMVFQKVKKKMFVLSLVPSHF
jgi:hypothetical protein